MTLSTLMIASALLLFSFNVDIIMGIPLGFVEGDYLFGRTVGIVDDENGNPVWIVSGHLEDQFIKSNSSYKQQ